MSKFTTCPKISSLENCDAIFECIKCPRSEDDNLRILDSRDGYILIHYLFETTSNKHLRGIIVDTQSVPPQIVCASFPQTPELSLEDPTLEVIDWDKAEVTLSYEGTILRVWWGRDQWRVSTHKKINGKGSRWSGPPFGKLFEDVWKPSNHESETNTSTHTTLATTAMTSLLSKKICYVFLLSHPQNRVVCKYDNPILNFVGAFTFEDNVVHRMELSPENSFLEPIPDFIKIPTYVEHCNLDRIRDELEIMDWKTHSGLMVYFPVDNGPYKKGDCIKILHSTYEKYKNVRGNEPNICTRYLYLIVNGEDTAELEELYPENKKDFFNIEQQYESLPKHLLKYYNYRYVNEYGNNYLRLPKEEHYIIQTAHNSDDNEHSAEEKIRFVLKTSNPRQISVMISRMQTVTG